MDLGARSRHPQQSSTLVPGSWYQVPGTRYLVPSTRYLVLGTKCRVPGTRYQVPLITAITVGAAKIAPLLDNFDADEKKEPKQS